MTENDLKTLEDAVSEDASPEAKSLRDLIDQVRGLKILVERARREDAATVIGAAPSGSTAMAPHTHTQARPRPNADDHYLPHSY